MAVIYLRRLLGAKPQTFVFFMTRATTAGRSEESDTAALAQPTKDRVFPYDAEGG